MKICMLAPEFIPAWGGVGTYIIELLKHLPKDYEIHLVTPMRASFCREKLQRKNLLSQGIGENIKIHYISTANDTFLYNGAFQYECFRQVPRILKEENIDLIHTHTAQMPDLLLMFRKLNIPIVTTVHTTIAIQRAATKLSQKNFSNMERSEKATILAYPFLRLSEEIYYRRTRLFISPSNWMKQRLKDSFHIYSDIPVIPNSVDLNDYRLIDSDEARNLFPIKNLEGKKIILFVGRLLAMKGVDTIIEAIPSILKQNNLRNLVFVFVGPGDRERYLRMARAKGVDSSCFFTGPLSRETVILLMRNAHLLVAPSFIENSPYTILESMACGLPVIATNVGGVSEIVKDGYNGVLLDLNSSKEIENLVLSLLNDESLLRNLSQHAVETIAKKFSWSVNLEKYLDVYEKACSNPVD